MQTWIVQHPLACINKLATSTYLDNNWFETLSEQGFKEALKGMYALFHRLGLQKPLSKIFFIHQFWSTSNKLIK